MRVHRGYLPSCDSIRPKLGPTIVRKADLYVGTIIVCIGLLLAYESLQLPTVEGMLIGPGSLPLGLGICLAVLGLILVLASAMGHTRDKVICWPQGSELRQIVLVALSFALYIVIVTILGYLISTLLMLIVLIRVMGNFRWRFVIPISLFFTIALYIIFQVWLQISLPYGFTDL